MVAIVAGNGLGLFNTSLNVLGSAGVLGQSVLGQAGGRSYVNAVTGNLVLQMQDEQLTGRGLGLHHLRTYNSLGELSDGDADGWRWGYEQTVRLTSGSINQVGSQVTRTDGDGHETTYTWDAKKLAYVSAEGSGAHDTIKYDSNKALPEWVWTEGSTRVVETYSNSTSPSMIGRLIKQTNPSGSNLGFTYDGSGRLISVHDTGNQRQLRLTYGQFDGLTRLQYVETRVLNDNGTAGALVRQVEYGYTNGRLTMVKSDLTPGNISDNSDPTKSYVTHYTYDADGRVQSMTQSDGTSVIFTYDTANRIQTVTDANGTATFTYSVTANVEDGTAVGRTDVSFDAGDGAANVWTYFHDAAGRLIEIRTPPSTAGGARPSTKFAYDADGNVVNVTDARGNVVTYGYDANGNRTLERDVLGNTVKRTFDGRNQLVAETRYKTPDPDGAGTQQPSGGLTTRYVYDQQSRLRFVISPEGRVIENRYGSGGGAGLLAQTLQYTGSVYDVSGLSETATLTETQLNDWVNAPARDKSQVQITTFEYDVRGNLSKQTSFASADANGAGVLDAAASVTEYVYDPHGQLLQTIAVRSQRTTLTSLTYDGLGRELTSTSGSGTRTTVYDGPNRQIRITSTATGLVETRSYDTRGRLVSVSRAGDGTTREIKYVYDAAGRLRMTQDAQGGRRYNFYDTADRLEYTVDNMGAVTRFEHNATGQLTKETRYLNRIAVSTLSTWYDSAANTVTKASLTVGTDVPANGAHDRVTTYAYDNANRLTTVTDAGNEVTTTSYDGLSRVVMTQTGDRVTRNLYDEDGYQVGTVDPLGYLTEYKRDGAGRLVETVRYSTRSPAASNMAAPVWIGVTNQSASGGRPFEYRVPAYDADLDSLSYSVVGDLPSWLTLDTTGATPTLRGTPPATLTSYSVTLRASDNRGNTTAVTIAIAVVQSASGSHESANTLTLAPLPPMDVVAGSSASYTVPAGTASEIVTYSILSGLPPGFSFDPFTQTISGASSSAGFYAVVLLATTPDGQSASVTLALHVRSAATPPVESTGSDALSAWRPADASGLRSYVYYNGRGQVVGSVDERGFLSESVYDEQGNTQRSVRYLRAVTVGSGDTLAALRDRAGASQTSTVEFDGFGRVSRSIGADGTVTRNEYDSAGRLLREVRAEGTTEQRASRVRYNAFSEITGTLGGAGEASGLAIDDAIAQYGIRHEYDTLGRRVKTIDANNDATLYFYDRENRLTHTVNAEREVTQTVYNRYGQIESTRRYANKITQSNYSALQGTGGSATKLDNKLVLDQAKDEVTSNEYDRRGLLVKQTDGEGVVTINSYSAFGQLAAQVRAIAQGKTTTTQFDYDLRGALLSQTGDVGGSNFNTRMVRDAFGRVIQSIDAAGNVTTSSYQDSGRTIEVTDALNRTVRSEYDAFSRVLKQTDALGKSTTYTYDDVARSAVVTTPEGVQVTTRRTRHGETLDVVDGRGNTTSYEYDKDGRLTKVTDALGRTVSANTYQNSGRLLQTTDARGTVTQFSYDHANRLLERRVDPNGLNLKTVYEFNALGRQIRVTDGADSGASRTTSYQYDRNGQLKVVVVDPNGLRLSTRYTFDGLGNTVKVERGTVASPRQQVTLYVFDSLGRRIKEIDAPSSELGTGVAGTRDLTTQYRYDAAGQVSRTIDANGRSTWYVHDAAGQLTHTINELGEVSESKYDANGRLSHSRRYLNRLSAGAVAGFGDVVRLSVGLGDPAGTFTPPAVDGNDSRSVVVRDADGRVRYTLTANSADSWTISESRYDANGNVIETRRYDKFLANARVVAIDTAGSQGVSEQEMANELATLGYDDSAPDTLASVQITRHAYDANNRLRFTVDALGSISESVYDALGNVVSTTRFAAPPTLADYSEGAIDGAVDRGDIRNQVTRFAYDADNRLRFTVDALGSISERVYDALGNVVSTVRFAARPTLTAYGESAIDGAVSRSDVNNQVTRFAYDKDNRLRFTVDALGSISESVYDARGNVVTAVHFAARPVLANYTEGAIDAAVNRSDAGNQVARFVYDADNRLRFTVDALGSISESVYDALGNVVSTIRFAARPALSSYTEGAIESAVNRDDAGNQVTRFAYDADNRLRFTVDALGSISERTYDALGNLASSVRFAARPTLGDHSENAINQAMTSLRGDPDNQVTRFAYDAGGRLRFTIDALGSIGESVYDALGNVVSTVRFAARPTNLTTYSESDIDSNVDRGDVSNQVTRFAYDENNRLRFSVDALGSISESVYDALGNVVSTVRFAARPTNLSAYSESDIDSNVDRSDGDNQVTRFAYDADNRLRFSVDALGSISESVYDALGNMVSTVRFAARPTNLTTYSESDIDGKVNRGDVNNQVTRFAYDESNRLRFTVDALGSISETAYDVLGNVVSTVRFAARPTNLTTHSESDIDSKVNRSDANNQVTRFAYDESNRLRFTVDALGSISETVYDVLGNVVSTVRFAARPTNLTTYSESDIGGKVNRSDANNQVTRFAYDENNRLRFSVDALGSISESVYDVLGNVVSTVQFAERPTNLTTHSESDIDGKVNRSDATNQVTHLAYDENNRLRFSVDALGSISESVYDALGNVVSTFRFAERPTNLTTHSESDIDGKVNRSDASNQVTRLAYDADNRLRFTVDALGSISENVYDALGNVVSTVRFAARPTLTSFSEGAIDSVVNRSDVDNQVTRFAYDADNRLRFTVDALGSISENAYDALGNVASTVRFAERPTLTSFSEGEIDSAVNRDHLNNRVSRFAYDEVNRLRFTVDALGSINESVYDALGNVVSTVRFAARPTNLTTYSESDIDSKVNRTDGNNQVTRFAYDELNRLRFTVDALGSISESVYDALGNAVSSRRFAERPTNLTTYSESDIDGKVNRTDDNNQVTRFAYDELNRLRFTVDALGSVSESVYDALGNVVSSTRFAVRPTNLTTCSESDIDGKVNRTDGGNQVTRFAYDELNRLRFTVDALGSISESVYDALGNVVRTVRFATRPTNLATYSESGIDGKVDRSHANNQVTRFAYDKNHRLRFTVDARGSVSESRYDARGNVIETRRYDQSVANAWIVSTDTAASPGISELEMAFVLAALGYDNNTPSTLANVQRTRFVYDTQDWLRFTVDALGSISESVWDALGNVVSTVRFAARPTNLTTYSESDIDGKVNRSDANNQVTRFAHDELNRLRFTVDALGSISESVYDALGNVVSTVRFAARPTNLTTYSESDIDGKVNRGDADNQVTRFAYDELNRLRFTVDALGAISESVYDALGNVVSTVRFAARPTNLTTYSESDIDGKVNRSDADNQVTRFAYDNDNRLRFSVDALGSISESRYDARGNLIETRRYDKFLPKMRIAERDTTSSPGIAEHEMVSELATLGYSDSTLDTLANVQRTRFAYDVQNQLRFTVDALGAVSESVYDALGQVISSVRYAAKPTLAESAYIESIIHAALDRANANNQVEHYAYDAAGQLRFSVQVMKRNMAAQAGQSPQGEHRVTEHRYDALGQLTETRAYATAVGYLASYDEQAIAGKIVTTAQDRRSAVVYDAAGRQIYSVQAVSMDAGQVKYRVSRQQLDAFGQVIASTAYATTVALGAFDEATIDAAVVQVADATKDRSSGFVYDAAGQVIYSVQVLTSGKHQVSKQAYDTQGQLVSTTTYATAVTLADFDKATIDAAVSPVADATKDRTSGFVYDAAGQLIYNVLVLTTGKHQVVRQDYDAQGRLLRVTAYVREVGALPNLDKVTIDAAVVSDANDRTTLNVYDADGRQRYALQAASGGRWTISENRYDARANLIETRRYDEYVTDAWIASTDTVASPGISELEMAFELAALGYHDDTSSTLAHVQRTRFAYDTQNQLRFTVDALGSVSESVYNALGQMISSVRYAAKPTLTQTQYTESAISAAVNRDNDDNRVERYAYDAAGQLRFNVKVLRRSMPEEVHALGEHLVTEHDYDALGQLVRTTSYAVPVGNLPDYETQTIANWVSPSAQIGVHDRRTMIAYDAAGRKVYTVQERGADFPSTSLTYAVTKLVYDALGQVLTSTAYATAVTLSGFDEAAIDIAVGAGSANDRTTAYLYDAAGRQRFVVAADGSFAETTYDALGQVSEARRFSFNVNADTQRTVAELSAFRDSVSGARFVGDGFTRGEKYTYDAAGRRLSTTDAGNHVEHYTYNALGDRDSFTDKNGNTWTYEYDRKGQRFKETSPPVRFQLSTEFDSGPAETDRRLETRFEFDAFGNVIQKVEAANFASDARTTDFEYDTLGRLTKTTLHGLYDPDAGKVVSSGTGQKLFRRSVELDYDTLGNVVRSGKRTGATTYQYEYKTYDVLGRVVHDIDALGNVTAFTHTTFGEQETVTRHSVTITGTPANTVNWTAAEIDSQIAGDTEARTLTMSYDSLGRKTQVAKSIVLSYFYSSTQQDHKTDPVVTPVNARAITDYAYNTFGELHLERVTVDSDPNNSRSTFHYYDVMGREIRSIDATGIHTSRSYDALGNLKETVEYAVHGLLGSSASFTPPPPPGPMTGIDRITGYTYDARNQQISVQRYGLSFTSWDGTQYVHVSKARSEATTVQSTTYDGVGNVETQTDALGNTTTLHYNALNQLDQVTEPARLIGPTGAGYVDPFRNQVQASPQTFMTYDAFGNVVTTLRGIPPFDFDSNFRNLRITKQRYDAAGNLVGNMEARGHWTHRQVDYAGRVIKQTQTISKVLGDWLTNTHTLERRYVYDAAGRQTHALDVYLDMDGATTMQSGQRAVYNAFGEVREEQRVWGAHNAAISSLSHVKVATYTYDNAGQLVTRRAADGLTRYFYNLAGEVTRQEQRDDVANSETLATRIIETGYDRAGRAIIQRLPYMRAALPGAAGGMELLEVQPFTKQGYDRWGNVTSRSQGGYLKTQDLTVNTSLQSTTLYQYNHDNQVIKEVLPTVQASGANGAAADVTPIHEIRYDILGRAVQERDLVDSGAKELRKRSKEYNSAGQLIAETDATKIRTEYAYNAFGDRVGTKNAYGSVFVDEFDHNGNITSHGVLRAADYTSAYTSTPSSPTPVVILLNVYDYDQANRRVASQEIVAHNFSGAFGSWSYTKYDERNLVREQRNGMGAVVSRSQYDVLGNTTREEAPGGYVQTWNYSKLDDYSVGRLVSTAAGTRTMTYEYNDFGQLKRTELTNLPGATQYNYNLRTYSYHDNGLLREVVSSTTQGSPGGNAATLDYLNATETTRYDYTVKGERAIERLIRTGVHETGNVDAQTGQALPVAIKPIDRTTYTYYDKLGRMTRVTESNAHTDGYSSRLDDLTYRYDELGNIRNIQTNYHQYADGPQRSSDLWYDHDAEGRVKVADGRLVNGAVDIDVGVGKRILYDGIGRRKTQMELLRHVGGYGDFEVRYDVARVEWYDYNDLNHLEKVRQQLGNVNRWGLVGSTGIVVGGQEGDGFENNAVMESEEERPPPGPTLPPPEDPPPPDEPPPGNPIYGYQSDQWTTLTDLQRRINDNLGRAERMLVYQTLTDISHFSQQAQLVSDTTSIYRADGQLYSQTTDRPQDTTGKSDSSVLYNYDATGILTGRELIQGHAGQQGYYRDVHTYTYVAHIGGLKESVIAVRRGDGNGILVGLTTHTYDAMGQLQRQVTQQDNNFNGQSRPTWEWDTTTRNYVYDIDGRIRSNTEIVRRWNSQSGSYFGPAPREQTHIYVNGRQVSTINSGAESLFNPAQFSFAYTPISSAYPATSPGQYVVNGGDTLSAIAMQVYGDRSLWYLIADANGLGFGPDQALPSAELGKTYRTPSVVTHSNHATTFQPYNASRIIADGTPSPLPPPPPTTCAQTNPLLAKVVVMAVQTILQVGSTVILTPFIGAPAAGAIGGAAGSLGGQLTAWGLGMQDGVDWGAVGRATIEGATFAGLTSGLSSSFAGGQTTTTGPFNAVGGPSNLSLGSRMAVEGITATTRELNNQAQNGFKDWTSLRGAGSSLLNVGLDVADARWGHHLDAGRFQLSNAATRLANNAFNPQSGWFFKDESRKWSNIATQAFGAFSNVFVSAAAEWAQRELTKPTQLEMMEERERQLAAASLQADRIIDLDVDESLTSEERQRRAGEHIAALKEEEARAADATYEEWRAKVVGGWESDVRNGQLEQYRERQRDLADARATQRAGGMIGRFSAKVAAREQQIAAKAAEAVQTRRLNDARRREMDAWKAGDIEGVKLVQGEIAQLRYAGLLHYSKKDLQLVADAQKRSVNARASGNAQETRNAEEDLASATIDHYFYIDREKLATTASQIRDRAVQLAALADGGPTQNPFERRRYAERADEVQAQGDAIDRILVSDKLVTDGLEKLKKRGPNPGLEKFVKEELSERNRGLIELRREAEFETVRFELHQRAQKAQGEALWKAAVEHAQAVVASGINGTTLDVEIEAALTGTPSVTYELFGSETLATVARAAVTPLTLVHDAMSVIGEDGTLYGPYGQGLKLNDAKFATGLINEYEHDGNEASMINAQLLSGVVDLVTAPIGGKLGIGIGLGGIGLSVAKGGFSSNTAAEIAGGLLWGAALGKVHGWSAAKGIAGSTRSLDAGATTFGGFPQLSLDPVMSYKDSLDLAMTGQWEPRSGLIANISVNDGGFVGGAAPGLARSTSAVASGEIAGAVASARRDIAIDDPTIVVFDATGKAVVRPRPPAELQHLDPDCMLGACGAGQTAVVSRLREAGVPARDIYAIQMKDIDPGAQHGITVYTAPEGQRYVIDTTYAQFTGRGSPQALAAEKVMASTGRGRQIREDLLTKGYFALDDEAASIYAQAVNGGQLKRPVGAKDFLRPEANVGSRPLVTGELYAHARPQPPVTSGPTIIVGADAYGVALNLPARAAPPSSVVGSGFGDWRANWLPGDRKALVTFEPHSAGGISIVDIFRGGQPRGTAGQMLADSLRAVHQAQPAVIRTSQITNRATLDALEYGATPGETVLGRTTINAVRELGGQVTGWTTGVERGKTWIEATIKY